MEKNKNLKISADGCQGSPHALGTRADLWFGHGCSGHRMRSEHERTRMFSEQERNHGLGMDALVTVGTTLWSEHSPNLKVHKPSIFSLASRMAAWSTPLQQP